MVIKILINLWYTLKWFGLPKNKLISIHDCKHRIEDRCNPKISRNLGYTKSTALSFIANIFVFIRLIEPMFGNRAHRTDEKKRQGM